MIRVSRHLNGGGSGGTAFVFSGGGSLGAVQVGMLQALFENDVAPDFLVGTSVGAVNAAWVAGRPDTEAIAELAEIWMSLRRQHVFPLSPVTSARGLLGKTNHLISNASLRSLLEKHIPYRRLEEAHLPVHVVATDLKNGRAVGLASGPAVPVEIGRRDYIDGGVANHTPITVALELGATRIFVLPVGYPWLNREPANALGMALHALARIVEQKLEADVASSQDLADIHVMPTPDVADVSPADFSHTAELIDWGYRSARRQLAGANGHRPAAAGRVPSSPRLRADPVRAA